MGFFDEDEEYQRKLVDRKVKNAALLGEWIRVMFWLQIVAVILGLFEELFEESSVLAILASLASYGISIANSVILIKLKEVEDWFKSAGICYLISGLSGFVIAVLLLGGATLIASLLTIAIMVVQVRGNYCECTGYEVVLQGLDNDLAEKWARQWKLELICTVTLIVSAIVMLVSAFGGGGFLTVLAGFVALIASVGALILGIMRLIYLYRTSEIFQNYKPEAVGNVVDSDDL